MTILDFILFGVSLSMDALAVSTVKGLTMPGAGVKEASLIALFFGGFQFLMPVLGWLLGTGFQEKIQNIDHWVAFALLAFIGIKMVKEAVSERKHPGGKEKIASGRLDLKELTLLAIATSIDALAVGITFAFLGVDILLASSVIGLVTFAICFGGFFLGRLVGTKFSTASQIAGGCVLIFLGTRILLEHLGLFAR